MNTLTRFLTIIFLLVLALILVFVTPFVPFDEIAVGIAAIWVAVID